LSIKELVEKLEPIRKADKTIVFTNGVFDILHAGHVDILTKAKELGHVLVVGINSDDSVKALKGPNRPINNETNRAYLISALKPVDFVVIFSERTPEEIISKIKPDIHVKGGDYVVEEMPETKIVKKYGGKVILIKFSHNLSTTGIIKKIKDAYC
jgi:glycerol-3-phosphate cytidylyltransferase